MGEVEPRGKEMKTMEIGQPKWVRLEYNEKRMGECGPKREEGDGPAEVGLARLVAAGLE